MMRISGSVDCIALAGEQQGTGWLPRKEEEYAAFALPAAVSPQQPAPVLLLGLGNPLMSDDGAGQELLSRLAPHASEWGERVEYLDGGTQGLALLGTFEGRKAVVFLDAVRFGDKPGAAHILSGEEVSRMGHRATTAHEGSAPQILAALQLLQEIPEEVVLIGLEPEIVQTGIGLSPPVQAGLATAVSLARSEIKRILSAI